jgi:hypothetical protein
MPLLNVCRGPRPDRIPDAAHRGPPPKGASSRLGRKVGAMTRSVLLLALLSAAALPAQAQVHGTVTGTGFVVSAHGHIVTAYHVVSSCAKVMVSTRDGQVPARIRSTDRQNDLALLELDRATSNSLVLRENPRVRLGEGVLTIGYPLQGIVTSSAQLTTGTVSGLAGLGDDTRFLQFTAPVQPGNSGGPLLDESGNVIGVVTSKLSALWAARNVGDVPQNVNFALKAGPLAEFLSANQVPLAGSPSDQKASPADLAERLVPAVVSLSCAAADERLSATTATRDQRPVSPLDAIRYAKTLRIVQTNGNPVISTEITTALLKWGGLALTSEIGQADLILQVTQTGQLSMSGSGNQAAAKLTHVETGADVWAATKGGGWAMSGWSNAWVGRAIAKDLIRFIELVRKQARK